MKTTSLRRVSAAHVAQGEPFQRSLFPIHLDCVLCSTESQLLQSSATQMPERLERPLEECHLIAWNSPARQAWHEVSPSDLAGGYVGLYFGARWCGPCHRFMEKLKIFYAWRKLEVVYVSLDNDTDQFKAYYKEMPWLAIHPDERGTSCKTLAARHGVMAIPAFVVYRPDGSVLTRSGVNALRGDPVGEGFPHAWDKPGVPTVNWALLVLLALVAGALLWAFVVR